MLRCTWQLSMLMVAGGVWPSGAWGWAIAGAATPSMPMAVVQSPATRRAETVVDMGLLLVGWWGVSMAASFPVRQAWIVSSPLLHFAPARYLRRPRYCVDARAVHAPAHLQ